MLNPKNSEKILKITQLLEKIELQEKEEKKKIMNSLDNQSYMRLLKNLYRNHEITTIISQEVYEIIDELNLLPLSQLFQKIINSFQIQLNKFLIYQLNYLKYLKIQKEAGSHTNTNNSLINIVSDPDLQNFDTSQFSNGSFKNLGTLKANNANNLNNMETNLKKSFSVVFKNFRNSLFHSKKNEVQEKKEAENIKVNENIKDHIKEEDAKSSENEETHKTIEREREMADMNNILDNKDKRLEEINMVEARNIAACSELMEVRNDIHKNKNSKVIYTGENLEFLLENEKINKNNNLMETESDEILRIPFLSKSKTKVLKQSVQVKKLKKQDEDEYEEKQDTIEETDINFSYKSRVKVTQHDLRSMQGKSNYTKNKGTEPDPEIFDINQIFALEVLMKKRNEEVDKLEEELKFKNATINQIELINHIQKTDLKNAKESLEKAMTKLAQFKLLEANLNLEDNNLKKLIINLQKEIGNFELKYEKKEEETDELHRKLLNLTDNLKELQKKNDFLTEENRSLKKETQILKLDNQKRSESNYETKDKMKDLEKKFILQKRVTIDELQNQETYISTLQKDNDILNEENYNLIEKINNLEHQLTLMQIENDKYVTSRKNSKDYVTKELNTSTPEKSPKKDKLEEKSIESRKNSKNLPFDSRELSRFSKDYISPRGIPKIFESRTTQTDLLKSNDSEAQTIEYKTIDLQNSAINAINLLNSQSSSEILKSLNITTNNNYIQTSSKPTHLEDLLSKTKNLNSPNNILNNLIQPNPINPSYIYPTKITESRKTNNNKKINQILYSEKKNSFSEQKNKNLEIKINQNNTENDVYEKNINVQRAKTDRFEIPLKSTQNIKERERHLSFNEKEITKMFNNQNSISNKNPILNVENSKSMHHEKKFSYDTSFIKKNHDFAEEAYFEEKPTQKSVFEMNNEEKEKRINQMFVRFKKNHQNIIPNIKNINNSSKIFSKKIQKNIIIDDFDEDKFNNFSDFREFFIKFIDIHKKCGKDCSHLKKFYEKIGWTEERNALFRHEIKLSKSVINSLPIIKN